MKMSQSRPVERKFGELVSNHLCSLGVVSFSAFFCMLRAPLTGRRVYPVNHINYIIRYLRGACGIVGA